MATQFSTLYKEALNNVGGRSDSLTTSRAKTAVNWGYTQIARLPIPDMQRRVSFSLVSSPTAYNEYFLPTDCWFIRTVREDTQNKFLPPRDISKIDGMQIVSGIPSCWARHQNIITFDTLPSAADTIIIRYQRRIVTLVADTDQVLTPVEWDEGIVLSATVKLCRGLGMYKQSRIWLADLKDNIGQNAFAGIEETVGETAGVQPNSSWLGVN